MTRTRERISRTFATSGGQNRWSTVAVAAISCLALGSCGDKPNTHPIVHELVLEAPPPESGSAGLLGGARLSHNEVLELLGDTATEKRVRGLLLHVGSMGSAFARVAELTRAIAAVKQANKPVHCHVRETDNAGYALLAEACERISMTPAGVLNLVGVQVQAIYARSLLERFGVHAEMLHAGRYKAAADILTETDMPPTTREAMLPVLDALQDQILGAMEQGRSITRERGQRLVDAGPYTAHAAHLAGLVDDVGFDDEARQHLRKATDTDRVERVGERKSGEVSLSSLLKALSGESSERPKEAYIRLVVLEGTIASKLGTMGNEGAVAAEFVPEMRALADDEACKGVALRIDSPGGSALASDRMWHAVRRVAKKKPVFVSIGDMAASGGFYIASAGTRIFAEEASLVGSIGVVGGKVSVAGTASKLGVGITQLKRGQNAAWTSPLSDLSDSEREAMRNLLDSVYRLFLRRVGQGRGMSHEQVEPLAEGRLLIATEALAGKLIDEHGGLEETLSALRHELGVDERVEVSVWPGESTALGRLLSGNVEAQTATVENRIGLNGLLELMDPEGRFAALHTLVAGEPMATALPYSLRIR